MLVTADALPLHCLLKSHKTLQIWYVLTLYTLNKHTLYPLGVKRDSNGSIAMKFERETNVSTSVMNSKSRNITVCVWWWWGGGL